MAHRGRLYPVNFRRDFNQGSDVSNTRSLAHDYQITLDSNTSRGYPVDGQSFVCSPTVSPDVRDLRWLSDVRHLGNFDWQLSIRARLIDVPDTRLQSFMELARLDVGPVARWQSITPD